MSFTDRIKPFSNANDNLAQAQWSEKKWVWIADKEAGYLSASVISENGDKMEVIDSLDAVR